MLHFK